MKEISTYIRQQAKSHPAMLPQDLVKLCYQAACGAEHLLIDKEKAWKSLLQEYEAIAEDDKPLFEPISETSCRVNLSAWKKTKYPLKWLFVMFCKCAEDFHDGKEKLGQYLTIAEKLVVEKVFFFTVTEWNSYVEDYRAAGMPTIHHSERYHRVEKPAYRILNSEFQKLLPLLTMLSSLKENDKPYILAIEGRCAAGKTTLAAVLSEMLTADVIHMDDFFLPPMLQEKKRLKESGGNIHYERFIDEVLPHIADKNEFSYRIFNCHSMEYNGTRNIRSSFFRIVEGCYCMHPIFGTYADTAVFLDISTQEQQMRILKRNGIEMAETFKNKWIPMEETYFNDFQIRKEVDFIINTSRIIDKP